MKAILINLFMIMPILAFGQLTSQINNQSNKGYIEKKLPVLKVDPCLFNILKTVVDNDSLRNYYRKDSTAYLLSINKQEGFYLLSIRPIYLDRVEKADYFGAFEFSQRKFLCWGYKLDKLLFKSPKDSLIIRYNIRDEINDFYLGGDVPSKKELITCKDLKLYFVITASPD